MSLVKQRTGIFKDNILAYLSEGLARESGDVIHLQRSRAIFEPKASVASNVTWVLPKMVSQAGENKSFEWIFREY